MVGGMNWSKDALEAGQVKAVVITDSIQGSLTLTLILTRCGSPGSAEAREWENCSEDWVTGWVHSSSLCPQISACGDGLRQDNTDVQIFVHPGHDHGEEALSQAEPEPQALLLS